MKHLFLSLAMTLTLSLFMSNQSFAQKTSGTDYKTGIGIRLDLGTGGTFVGPAVKHYFSKTSAGEGSVLFGDGLTMIGAEYSYNGAIKGADGLKWNAGLGPQIALYDGGSDVFIRPMAGLEFKVPEVPLSLGFDWRPVFQLTHDTDFEAGRFGIALRFTLN